MWRLSPAFAVPSISKPSCERSSAIQQAEFLQTAIESRDMDEKANRSLYLWPLCPKSLLELML